MPPIQTIALIVIAYVAIAVLLLSLNIASRWRWWVKGGAMAITGVFFVLSYFSVSSLLGWPDPDQLPERFQLLSTRVVEPNRAQGEVGAIYLWIELLNDDNVPSGQPLSYKVPYGGDLADAVGDAQDVLDSGEAVEASLQEMIDPPTGDQASSSSTNPLDPQASGANTDDYVRGVNLVFNDMPAVRLPSKGPL